MLNSKCFKYIILIYTVARVFHTILFYQTRTYLPFGISGEKRFGNFKTNFRKRININQNRTYLYIYIILFTAFTILFLIIILFYYGLWTRATLYYMNCIKKKEKTHSCTYTDVYRRASYFVVIFSNDRPRKRQIVD